MKVSMSRWFIAVMVYALLPVGWVDAHTAENAGANPSVVEVEQALNGLRSDDWIIQVESIELLASWRLYEAVDELRNLMDSAAPVVVRSRALLAVASLGGKDELETVIAKLENEDEVMRAAALESLAIINSERGKPAVIRAFNDPSDMVKVAALKAAADMRLEEAIDAAASIPDTVKCIQALAEAVKLDAHIRGVDALEPTLNRLSHEVERIRVAAVGALSLIDDQEATNRLVGLLSDDELLMRRAAVWNIGKRGILETLPAVLAEVASRSQDYEGLLEPFARSEFRQPLLDALQAEDRAVAAVAIRMLSREPTEDVGKAVASVVNQAVDEFSAVFSPDDLRALSEFGAERFVPLFVTYIENDNINPYYRMKAIERLERAENADLFELLRNTVMSDDDVMREASLCHLARFRRAPAGGIVRYIRDVMENHEIRVEEQRLRQGEKSGFYGLTKPFSTGAAPGEYLFAHRRGGNSVWLLPIVERVLLDNWRTLQMQNLCIANIRSHIRPPETGQAIELLTPFLLSSNSRLRKAAATAIEHVADERQLHRLNSLQGYITEWMVCGTFPNDENNTALGVPFPPEHELGFRREYGDQPFIGFGATCKAAIAEFDDDAPECIVMYPGNLPDIDLPRSGTHEYSARLIAAFGLELPDEPDLRFKASVALDGRGGQTNGFRFAVSADGNRLGQIAVDDQHRWHSVDINLDMLRGRKSILELEVLPRRETRHEFAYIRDARVVAKGETATDLIQLLPEAKMRSVPPGPRNRRATWQRIVAPDAAMSLVDFITPVGYSTAYAVAELFSPDEREARLELESSDGYVVFFNGQRFEDFSQTDGNISYEVITLQPGENRIMIKTVNRWSDQWWLRARISQLSGAPFKDVQVQLAR